MAFGRAMEGHRLWAAKRPGQSPRPIKVKRSPIPPSFPLKPREEGLKCDQGSASQCEGDGTLCTVCAIWIDKYPYYFTSGEIGKLGNIYRLRKIYRLCDAQGLRRFITGLNLRLPGLLATDCCMEADRATPLFHDLAGKADRKRSAHPDPANRDSHDHEDRLHDGRSCEDL